MIPSSGLIIRLVRQMSTSSQSSFCATKRLKAQRDSVYNDFKRKEAKIWTVERLELSYNSKLINSRICYCCIVLFPLILRLTTALFLLFHRSFCSLLCSTDFCFCINGLYEIDAFIWCMSVLLWSLFILLRMMEHKNKDCWIIVHPCLVYQIHPNAARRCSHGRRLPHV